MTDQLLAAVRAVHSEFMPTENSVGQAASRTARLLATVLEQHGEANLAIGTGSVLIRKLSKSLVAQLEAREEFAMAHKLAAALPTELGIDLTMFGDVVECPPDDPHQQRGADDKVVRLAA